MDWIAGAFELIGLWLIGNKRKVGFICNFIGCSVWVYVAIDSKLHGLLLVVVPAIIINLRNYYRWRNNEKKDN